MEHLDRSIQHSKDETHITYAELSEQAMENADDLQAVWRKFQNGEQIVGNEFDHVRGQLKIYVRDLEASKEQLRQQVAEELLTQRARQDEQQSVSHRLHQNIDDAGEASLVRDRKLEQLLRQIQAQAVVDRETAEAQATIDRQTAEAQQATADVRMHAAIEAIQGQMSEIS